MTNTVLKVELDESGYFGGQWFDTGGVHFVNATKRLRTAFEQSNNARIADEFVATSDLPPVQVGKLDANAVSTGEITGPVTSGAALTSLVGDNLSVRDGRLNATSAATGVRDDGVRILDSVDSINFRADAGATFDITDDGNGTATVGVQSSLHATPVSSSYVAEPAEFVLADASGGSFSVTLPVPEPDRPVGVKKVDATSNEVSVAPNGSESIDNQSPYPLASENASLRLISDGTDWYGIG